MPAATKPTSLWPYRRAILKEALRGLWLFVKDHVWWEFGFIAVVLAVSYWQQHKPHWMDRALQALIPTVIVLGAALVVVALWQFIDAPARLLSAREATPEPEGGTHLMNAEKVEIIEEGDGVRRITMERADNIHFGKAEET